MISVWSNGQDKVLGDGDGRVGDRQLHFNRIKINIAWKNEVGTTEKEDKLGVLGFVPSNFIEGAELSPSTGE